MIKLEEYLMFSNPLPSALFRVICSHGGDLLSLSYLGESDPAGVISIVMDGHGLPYPIPYALAATVGDSGKMYSK